MAAPTAPASPGGAPAPGGAGEPPVATDTADAGLAATSARRATRAETGLSTAVPRKLLTALLGLAVFILAIELLKTGARGIAPLADFLQVHEPLSAMGFGWVLAYVVLSGSPIAATALGLYAGGLLDEVGTYMMIAGSRLGAAFIVLLLGFLYTLGHRHRHRRTIGLHAGVLSLLVTYTVYGPGIVLGFVLLQSHALDPYSIHTPPRVLDLLDASFGAVAQGIARAAPHPALVFVAGLAVVLAAFKLFDLALPDVKRRAGRLGQMAERIYRPSVMFGFGFLVTALTLSVSVSLSLLVPLTVKGFIRRENLIPYIMGANVSTFIDTLFASVVVGGAAAFTIVLAEMLGVALVSLVVIALAYSHYEEAIYRVSHAILASRRGVAGFLMVILICPLLLLLL